MELVRSEGIRGRILKSLDEMGANISTVDCDLNGVLQVSDSGGRVGVFFVQYNFLNGGPLGVSCQIDWRLLRAGIAELVGECLSTVGGHREVVPVSAFLSVVVGWSR